MALEQMGLGGVLSFDPKPAQAGMSEASRSFNMLGQTANLTTTMMGEQLMKVGKLISDKLGFTEGLKGAMEDQQVLAQVGAEANLTSQQVESLAQTMDEWSLRGQADCDAIADAYMKMAQMGVRGTQDLQNGLEGVMSFSEATGKSTSESANLVIKSVQQMGLEMTKAGYVSDVYASVSNQTKVSMVDLATTMSRFGTQFKTYGMSFEQATATLGALANGNQRGAQAVMGLQEAYRRMMKPGKQAIQFMRQWGIAMTDSKGNMLPLADVVAQVKEHLDKMPSAYQRNAAAQALFGFKGARAYTALSENLKVYNGLMETMDTAGGAAMDKAAKRNDNLLSMWAKFKKDLRMGMEMFMDPIVAPLTEIVRGFGRGMKGIWDTFRQLKGAAGDATKEEQVLLAASQEFGPSIAAIARGFFRASEWMGRVWNGIIQGVQAVGKWLSDVLGPKAWGFLAEFGAKLGLITAAVVPLMAVFTGLGFIFKSAILPLFRVAIGMVFRLGAVFKLAFGPWGLIILGVVALLQAMRKEGETLGDVFGRIFKFLDETFGDFFRGLMSTFQQIWFFIKKVVDSIAKVFDVLFGWLFRDSSNTGQHMKGVFWDIGRFIGKVFVGALKLIANFFNALADWIVSAREDMQDFLANVDEGWQNVKHTVGALTDEEYAREKRRINFIREMTNQERGRRIEEAQAEEKRQKELEAEMEKQAEMEVAGKREERKPISVAVNLEDKRSLNIKNSMCVDGKQVAYAVANVNKEIQERAGFKANWWQRRAAAEYAAVPLF